MAAPTSVATAEVLALAAGSATPIDSNLASRQLLTVTHNGNQPVTIVLSSSGAPTIAVGKGLVMEPGDRQWLWCGPGIRAYAKVGPVAPGETAIDQVTGAALWIEESA